MILDPDFTKLSNGGSYNVTTAGVTASQISFQYIVENEEEDTALYSLDSKVLGKKLVSGILVRVSGKASLVGEETAYSFGTNDVAFFIPLGELKYDGDKAPSESGKFIFDVSSMTNGDSVTVSVTIYLNFDLDEYKQSGTVNDEAVSLATMTFYIKK